MKGNIALVLLLLGLSGCASTTDIGKGLQVGAMGANAGPFGPVLWVTGLIMEKAGSGGGQEALQPDSEEFKHRKAAHYNRIANFESYLLNKELLKPSVDTTKDQISISAKTTCDKIDDIIKNKGNMKLSRSMFRKMKVPDVFMPEGDEEIILYPLTDNPFNDSETCIKELTAAGERLVAIENKKIAKQ